eukprot:TRINITY_DN45012_c0_g1_i1.p1 TRINITY_DN45012_c0_g1~~TRINITY_DN45012_c0_g1_i1.p1  ORF type:complete len:289 (-),score=66.63 TRINITY_DN45012_c0_g1_i1:219-1010(-)
MAEVASDVVQQPVDAEEFLKKIAARQQELSSKKTFVAACKNLAELCEASDALPSVVVDALLDASKRGFTVLQTRFSTEKFWQAGLELFLAIECHAPPSATTDVAKWRDAAIEEVDEECREKARQQRQLRKIQEERAHNKGRWSDANVPVTREELLAASGIILENADDDRRPGMSRDAQDELRIVTSKVDDVCVICQEALPAGSKVKAMPCGHVFHDDCLMSWVGKNNSCPTCRNDVMASEKRHFDIDQRRIQQASPSGTGLYA